MRVQFTDISTGNPTSWNWEFSNGTLSSAQNPVVTFADPGTYSVKLVVQNESGIDEIERISYITVVPSPTASFTSNMTLACAPALIYFIDQSNPNGGTITNWDWEFGDGATSTLQNPTHTYANVGFYTVTLTVTSSNGCRRTITRSNYIRVVGGVETDFTFDPPSSCQPPYSVSFQNQSSGPGSISYTWDFGNSQTSTATNPTATYNAPGTYTVTLQAQSNLGCSGSMEHTITISPVNTDFVAPAAVCLNQPVVFQNNSSEAPLSSLWTFGDGTFSGAVNPVKTFLTPGVYDVMVINEYSTCTDSLTRTVTVNDRPVVDFTTDDSSSCQAPFTVQFTDLTTGAMEWLWDFGDGSTSTQQNPAHTYTAVGDYSVTLTASVGSSGCSASVTRNLLIKIRPTTVSINAPSGGCVPFTYTPAATIQTVDSIVSYLWDLGVPGAVFTGANPPTYTYTSEGAYTVTLTVTTASGCTETVSVPNAVLVGSPPTAGFTFDPQNACASDTISFTNTSVVTPGAEIAWLWDFGDGTTATLENPGHVFLDTGLVTVMLIVTNNLCPDTISQDLTVRPPVALFNYSVDCATRQVTFRDTSLVDPALSPISYTWEMGDPSNTTFNVKNPPPFTYPGPGTYDVTLTVTNGPCSYQTTKSVTIADETAAFTVDDNTPCRNQPFTLSAITSNAANLAGYTWIIEGETIASSERSVTHRLAVNGVYDVTLTITDINGCTSTVTMPDYLTVGGPEANFVPATTGACLSSTTTFTDLSTPAGGIVNWLFDFGDGTQQNFSSGPFTHTYGVQGSYTVQLTVTDAQGCTDTYSGTNALVVSNPKAGFRGDTLFCPGAALNFIDTSSGAGLTYLWDFGDGNTSTQANPQHSYPLGEGDYTVKLTVRDISGCSDSIVMPDYVKIRTPKAAFRIDDSTTICPPLRTTFFFQGSDYESFYWDFGDGGVSTLTNPSYFYDDYGTFNPTLYVKGPGGCIDSASSTVTVHNPGDVRINYGPPTSACNSLNVDFDLVVPPGFKFYFHFGDGAIDSSGSTSFSHFYPRPSRSVPRLVIFDTISGCQASINGSPRIDVMGAVPLFGKDISEFCDSGPVVFRDFTTKNEPIISTLWNFGDGQTSTQVEPTHTFSAPGTYLVTLNITTESNCASSYTDTIFVYRTPQPSIQSRDTICVSTPEPINGVIAVVDTVTNWQWNFGNGQTSGSPNNSVTYNTPGEYTLQLVTSNTLGCADTALKTIYVTPPPTASAVQDPITINVGGGTDLLMNYTGNISSYSWTPATGLSCTTCPTPFARPSTNTTYTLTVENPQGCYSSEDVTVLVVCNGLNYFMPNTFSPNNDGQNDVFYPRGSGLFRIKSLLIFNRWGEIVFERREFNPNDRSAGWDGTYKGKPASSDVYVYMLEILCENNTVIPLKGNVTLLR